MALAATGALLLGACADDTAGTADDLTGEAGETADDVVTEANETAAELADQVDGDELDRETAELAATLRANGMGTLASAVEQVDLSQLVDSEEFTLFGPNDEAFLSLEADTAADLLANPDELIDVLRNHVIERRVEAADLATLGSIETQGGTTLVVATEGDTVVIGDAEVVQTDIDAGTGIIHVVDQVLTT